MSEVLSIDDSEPPSPGANLLTGVPCGYNLNRPADIEAFKTAVAGHNHQNIGKQVLFIVSDYFLMQSDTPSYDWRHVTSYSHYLEGRLRGFGKYEIIYDPDDSPVSKVVIGAIVEAVDRSQQIYIAAEDTRYMSLVQNS